MSQKLIRILEASPETRNIFLKAAIDFLESGSGSSTVEQEEKFIADAPIETKDILKDARRIFGPAALAFLAFLVFKAPAWVNDFFGSLEHLEKRGYIGSTVRPASTPGKTASSILEQALEGNSKFAFGSGKVIANEGPDGDPKPPRAPSSVRPGR